MLYIDNTMTNAPQILLSNQRAFAELLKNILVDDISPLKPDSVSGNNLKFNNGISLNEDLSVYKITDGTNSVISKIKTININEIYIEADIAHLDPATLMLEYIKPEGWSYARNDLSKKSTLTNHFSSIEFYDDGSTCKFKRGNHSQDINLYGFSDSIKYEIIYGYGGFALTFIGLGYRLILIFWSNEHITESYDTNTSDNPNSSRYLILSDDFIKLGADIEISQRLNNKGLQSTILSHSANGFKLPISRFFSFGIPKLAEGFSKFVEHEGSTYIVYTSHLSQGYFLFEFESELHE